MGTGGVPFTVEVPVGDGDDVVLVRQAGYEVVVINAGQISSPRSALATELDQIVRTSPRRRGLWCRTGVRVIRGSERTWYLEHALRLVRGTPLDGATHERRWSIYHAHTMRIAITDAVRPI